MSAPTTRKRYVTTSVLVSQSDEYQALDLRLPDSATRITGVHIGATERPAQPLARAYAAIVFGPEPYLRSGSTTEYGIPGEVTEALIQGRFPAFTGSGAMDMAPSLSAFDPMVHIGFFQELTDDVLYQALVLPRYNVNDGPGGSTYKFKTLYYAHSVSLGYPDVRDTRNRSLGSVPGTSSRTDTKFTTTPYDFATQAYVSAISLPEIEQTTGWAQNITGYWSGVVFPAYPTSL